MSIHVACPECQSAFHVGDEFAGLPGRCPECDALIQVPGQPSGQVEESALAQPYQANHSFDDFAEFPAQSRRPRTDEMTANRQAHDAAERRRATERTFDRAARAMKWQAVSRGFRNLMLAVVLVSLGAGLWCAFTFIDGVQPGRQNQFRQRENALWVGTAAIAAFALLLWGAGRIGCGRTPYVPGRNIAFPAGIIAGLTTTVGVLSLTGLVAGVLLVQQNLGAGAGLAGLGFCGLFPVALGFVIAELMGLISQIRIAAGLKDAAFSRACKVQFVLAVLVAGAFAVGLCAVLAFFGSEMGKKQQQMNQQAQQQQAEEQARLAKDDKAPAKKQDDNAKNRQRRGNGQAGQQQQPPPPLDWGEYPAVVYAINICGLLAVLIYTLASIYCYQLGRSAVRREVARLVGNDRDSDDHYRI